MANKPINALPALDELQSDDLLAVWDSSLNTAVKMSGTQMVARLTEIADGHGGISGIAKTGTAGLNDTYTITYADGTTSTFIVSNGAKGDTGDQTYVYIKYSIEEPDSDYDLSDIPAPWMGIYVGTDSTAPTHYTDYTWYKIKGPKGDGVHETAMVSKVGREKTYKMYTEEGEECGEFKVIDGEGNVSLVNGIAPDGDGDVATIVGSVEDLSLTIGSATIGDAYTALQDRQMLVAPALDFDVNELPLISGTRQTDGSIEIYKGASDGWIEFHGRTASVGNYRMFFNSSDVPSGKWLGKCDLLWSNTNPTTSFAAQTVAVDLSGYDFVMVIAYESTSADVEMSATIRNGVGVKGRLFLMANSRQFRAIEISSTGVTFGVGRSGAVGSNAVEDNTAAVPVYIYGISK